jgi:hypothetical protein
VTNVVFQSVSQNAQAAFGAQNTAANTGCNTPSTDNIPCSTPVFDSGAFNSAAPQANYQYSGRIGKELDIDRLYGTLFRNTQATQTPSPRSSFLIHSNFYTIAMQGNETHTFSSKSKTTTGKTVRASYTQRDFERKFFADRTNKLFCKTFLENAFRDPISGEIGKSIVFAESQNHAARLAQILNEIADSMFPGKYQSDFAVQVTSQVDNAQQMTINFTNNKILGSENRAHTVRGREGQES